MNSSEGNETIEILDHMGRKIGTSDRSVANRFGLWHVCAQVWVILPKTVYGHAGILFQRRSANKKVAPGFLDISASGHVRAGYGALATAADELEEELGIKADAEKLIHVGRRIDMYEAPNVLSRIFAENYFFIFNGNPAELKIQKYELEGLAIVNLEDGIKLFSSQTERVTAVLFTPEGSREFTVAASEFIPRIDNVYLRAFIAAKSHINGEAIVAI